MESSNLTNSRAVPSAFSSAIKSKCPRCRRGEMFSTSLYGFKLQKMNDNCPHCNLKFEREPGYFYVAMFISYAMNVIEMLAAGMLTYAITGNLEDPILYICVIFPVIILLSPINYRYSRVILLYWLTPGLNYNPGSGEDH